MDYIHKRFLVRKDVGKEVVSKCRPQDSSTADAQRTAFFHLPTSSCNVTVWPARIAPCMHKNG